MVPDNSRLQGTVSSLMLALSLSAGAAGTAAAQQPGAEQPRESPPLIGRPYLGDRGPGLPTSMFGTYIRRGEWLFYPFFEYYRDHNLEYAPQEFGVQEQTDYRGRHRASEGLFFIAYGVTERLAFEFEVAGIKAALDKAANDSSALPARLEQSGLGDVEGQIRWRWRRETAGRPEVFSYGEFVVPDSGRQPLIDTPGWELKFGSGLVRGFSWGTMTVRASLEYDTSSTSPLDIGEYAVEYLKRLSPKWRVYFGLEGASDELSAIAEGQWHITPDIFVRLNSGVGLTSKATDWSPEVGVVFALPTRRTDPLSNRSR